MADQDDKTLGEVYRLVERVDAALVTLRVDLRDHRHEMQEELSGIRQHLALLNDRTGKNEQSLVIHDFALENVKRDFATQAAATALSPDVKNLMELARDWMGVQRFGKAMWATLPVVGILGVLWLIWQSMKHGWP